MGAHNIVSPMEKWGWGRDGFSVNGLRIPNGAGKLDSATRMSEHSSFNLIPRSAIEWVEKYWWMSLEGEIKGKIDGDKRRRYSPSNSSPPWNAVCDGKQGDNGNRCRHLHRERDYRTMSFLFAVLQSCEPENQQECGTWLCFHLTCLQPNPQNDFVKALAAHWLTIQANCCVHAHGYRIALRRISNSSVWGIIKPLNILQLKAFGSAIELECLHGNVHEQTNHCHNLI